MITKTCVNMYCKQENPQPITNFSEHGRSKDGYMNQCKACRGTKGGDTYLRDKAGTRFIVKVNLSDHPELQQGLADLADSSFRTIEAQIIALIDNAVYIRNNLGG